MGKDIEIGIASETKAFKQGVEAGIIEPVEDAVKALDDLGDSKGPADLERGMRDAQDASERLEDEVQQTARSIERDFSQTYRRVADDAQTGMRRSGEYVGKFKEEALANFSEVSSSFDGTMQGLADGVQGTLGGAALAIGGTVGVAVGVLGAVGGAILQTLATQAEAAAQVVSDAFDDMVENQRDFVSKQFVLDRVAEILNDDTKLKYIRQWADMLHDVGVSADDITLAIAGNAEAQTKVNAALSEYETTIKATAEASDNAGDTYITLYGEVKNLRGEIDATNDSISTASDKYDIYSAAAKALADENHTAQEAIAQTKQGLDDLPSKVTTTVDVDTGPAVIALESFINRPRKLIVKAVVQDRYGMPVDG